MAKKEETYNEAIEKLRKIVAEIENGDFGCRYPVREGKRSYPSDQALQGEAV